MKRAVSRSCAALLLVAAEGCGIAGAETLLVPDDRSTIQAAIDAALEGDLVLVEPGTYTENLELRSGVDVAGREMARTLLGPEDSSLPTVSIANATAVRFSNFTLIDARVGLSVRQSNGIDVANVVFAGAEETALAVDGSAVEAANNVFFGNAVAVGRSNAAVEITSNIFAENGTAISTTLPLADPFQNVRANCYFANEGSPSDAEASGGAAATFGDPHFVDPDARDFHLREGSACIDVGRGIDVIDGSAADAGAYGGPLADPLPFPVAAPSLEATGGDGERFGIVVAWAPNLSHRVTSSTNPGGYRVYYKRGAPPPDDSPSAYDGTGASGGASPIDVGLVTSYLLEGLDSRIEPPLAPRLLDAQGHNEAVLLEWEAVDGADGYRVHYGVIDVTENRVDVGSETRHTVTSLENGTTYRFAVSAVARAAYQVAVSVVDNTPARHESALSPPASTALGDEAESATSMLRSSTPGPIEAYPPLPDEDACFIATAAFGSRDARDVAVLRAFRDRFLLTHAAGRWLVRRYYTLSPPAAAFLERHERLKPAVRAALKPLVLSASWLLDGRHVALGRLLVVFTAGAAGGVSLRCAQRLLHARRRWRLRAAAFAGAAAIWLVPGVSYGEERPAAPSSSEQARSEAASEAERRSSPRRSSPRWMYEIKGGYLYPDLDHYAAFYGEDRDTYFAAAGAFRFRDWLELGLRIGYRRDEGLGRLADGGEAPGAVRQEVLPVHAFADFIFERVSRRWAPYAGLGVGWALYRQKVPLQPDVDGRSDAGLYARAGVRFRFAGTEHSSSAENGPRFTRSYAFLEAEHFDADVREFELGGTAYLLGVRVELEL